MMPAPVSNHTGLNIQEFIDSHPLSPMQWLLLLQCLCSGRD